MHRRIAIVNRGEAAMRLIHAVRELNAREGHGIETVALHTEGERTAMFVREADHAYNLGPASARPYLDHAVLERALTQTGADAAWVGWGFVAEDAGFADLCARIGVTFIGPSGEAMRQLGDKIGAKLLAEKVGVPVAAWSDGSVDDLQSATDHARRIGYPLMLKAAAGGGGRGIRVVTSDGELAGVFERTREEAQRAFGSGTVFLERLVTGARHVEVQVISDGTTAWALGVRDCSVQRRNQKLLEESASPVLGPEQVAQVKASAERLAIAVGYVGAGTVEFLYQPSERLFSFLEVNTRLQVEHPVTELATDTDLVRLQLLVSAGGTLDGECPGERAHAIEARLNAEDPDRDFAPAPGRIALFRVPVGPGIRVDTGVAEGDTIPADFDSMIAKIIAYGATRADALARLRRALQDTTVVIEGGTTNKSFLLDLLDAPEVLDGSADTGWIDRVRTTGGLVNQRDAGLALVAAGIDAYDEAERVERLRFFATAHGGRPQARHDVGRAFDVKLRGVPHKVRVAQVGPQRYRVDIDGTVVEAELERLGQFAGRLTVGERVARVVTAIHGPDHLVEVDGVAHRVTQDEGGVLRAPAPALVVAVPVAVGDRVAAGAPVVVLESMKMETVLAAPFAARVKEVVVSANDQVGAGQSLLRLEPVGDAEEPAAARAGDRAIDLPEAGLPAAPLDRALAHLESVRSLLLGYDLTGEDGRASLAGYLAARSEIADGTAPEPLLAAELRVLTAFADLCDLARNRPSAEESRDERVHSPREFFHTYLHSLDADRERLPQAFRDRLERLLAHYTVSGLDRTPALEEAVYRTFLGQQRIPARLPLVSALLERWLAGPVPSGRAADRIREVLDRLVLATQLRYPTVGDLARSVRFRWFEAPVVDAARQAAQVAVREQLRYLSGNPGAEDYDRHVDALVASPEPVTEFLGERLLAGSTGAEPLVEVLARRHYREYTFHDLTTSLRDDRTVVTADYALDERPSHLVSTVGTVEELTPGSPLAALLEELVAAAPEGHQSVVDLYLSWASAPVGDGLSTAAAQEETLESLRRSVSALPVSSQVRRVAVAVAVPHPGGDGISHLLRFTFRPGPDGVVEDDLVRGLHPMVGRRLALWRLRDFDLTRLDSPGDVLLYQAVAPQNPSDVRLVALAQVRELSIVRDASGQVSSMPQAERAVASCLEAIRRARTLLPNGSRLDMNHIWIHIWPEVDAPVSELTALQRTVTPLTVGAGIEEVVVGGRVPGPGGVKMSVSARFSYQPGSGVVATVSGPPQDRLAPLDDYAQKVLRSRRRGTVYPYEIVPLLVGRSGRFVEHDLDGAGQLVPVDRPKGRNSAGIVVGTVTTPTQRYPEGLTRVVLFGDPTKALGAVAEAECSRICAALDLAESLGAPVEWFALSAGARISMDSGTENMDWVARGLRRIIEFTQGGGEINVIVTGINVGAQPYWNAEATMLMHTKGILVMTPDSAMVLTGKTSLDYSGGVSAEDNFGIGGYDRVMGPNGQAQYWAPDLAGAVQVLFAHYDHAYVLPGEAFPRQATTTDPRDRDVRTFPHDVPDSDFRTVGDIFSSVTNPERKKAFDIRTLMQSVADADHPTLERWAGMADAETSVVLDAKLGGHPVCLLGIESRPVPRRGFPPTDGPDTWTAGTLFPRSSKKAARAINAASGSRPLVVLANLSGFDGSPESMRMLQLEYGAEIGRAVVNFDGPVVFCVVSRYHGGAFVVFSKTLHDNMTVLAVEGSYASVIGGAPAAGVVFTGEVNARTSADPRVTSLEARIAAAPDVEKSRLRTELVALRQAVRSEKLGEVAAEFDGIHSIQRAVQVGSVDAVIPAAELRPRLIDAVEAGLAKGR